MLAAGIVLVILVVAASVWFVLGLERFAEAEADKEDTLRDPETPVVEFAVPTGVDPAIIRGRLRIAGFTSALERVRGQECLRIGCQGDERRRVRAVIAGALDLADAGEGAIAKAVVFEDERSGRDSASA